MGEMGFGGGKGGLRAKRGGWRRKVTLRGKRWL